MDYQKLGFKCGLEVHRQLSTNKLFCNCPSIVNDPKDADFKIKRKLRSTRGETQKLDKAAEFEKKKNRFFIYEGTNDSSCLVEFDEEPPHKVNQDAIKAALQVCKLFNCFIVDQIQFMRKTVIDGSNTSGFQRTALIGIDGFIKTSKGKVGIESVCLEEEAAKKIETGKDYVRYRLDRLGVPLLEIATDASIKDPDHAKEVAKIIGMIIKSTNLARSGIGSVRQDVNISISKSPRIEIKGFQELKQIPFVIKKEVTRLQKELKSKKDLKPHVRKANADGSTSYLRPMPGAARMYPETDVFKIEINKKLLDSIEIPELISERIVRLQKEYNLTSDYARLLAQDKNFTEFVSEFKNIDPKLIANALLEIPKEAKKRFNIEVKESHIKEVLSFLNSGKISSSSLKQAIIDFAKTGSINLADYKPVSKKDLESEIKKIIKSQKDPNIGSVMGAVMAKFRGKVDGKVVSELVKKNL